MNMLPRNPARREWTISQLTGVAVGAVMMFFLLAFVFARHNVF